MVAHAEPGPDPLAWIQRDKIRMGWSPAKPEQYNRMAEAGMNAVMPRLELDVTTAYDPAKFSSPLSEHDASIVKDLLEGSALAKKLGLHYFHCLGIACEPQTYLEGVRDNPARYNDGKLPSPLDQVYWKRTILDRADRAIKLLADREKYALDGIIIDPEMYALGGALYGEPDFGKFAFEKYLMETGQTAPGNVTTVEERRDWIASNKLGEKYTKWQFDRVSAMGRELRELVSKTRPNVIVGYVIYENRMWFNAMAAGLTTEKIPVFIGPESTYSGVMDDAMIKLLDQMKASIGVPCLLTPGVELGLIKKKVPYEKLKVLEGNIYQRSQYSAGYWVWAIYNFGDSEQEQMGFFKSLKVVNDALDRQAGTGLASSELKAAPVPVELPPGFHALLKDAALMTPVPAKTARARLPYIEPKLRGTYTQLLWPKEGERHSVTIRSIQLNPSYLDRCEARLFDAKGDQIYDGPTELNQTRTIWLPDVVNGVCAQVLSAGLNAFGIDEVNCPSMIYTDDMIVVNSRDFNAGRFYFYVPDGRKEFSLKLIGHPTMTADYKLYDSSGNKTREWKALKEDREESVKVTGAGIWCLEIQNLVNDGGFKLIDLPNFFSLSPDQVMVSQDL